MKTPSIKRVNEYFKDVDFIYPINSNVRVKLTTKKFVVDKELGCINEVSENGELLITERDFHCVWYKEFAKITN